MVSGGGRDKTNEAAKTRLHGMHFNKWQSPFFHSFPRVLTAPNSSPSSFLLFTPTSLAARLSYHGVLLQEDRGRLHHPDEQGVQVVLQLPQPLPLQLRCGLQSHQRLYQVLVRREVHSGH